MSRPAISVSSPLAGAGLCALTRGAGYTRRQFLGAGLCALAGAAPMQARPLHDTADFHFVVVNDLHFRDQRCAEWFDRVVAALRGLRPQPAFVMLAGDLGDLGTADEIGAVNEIFRTLPMPVRTVIGNHDYTLDGRRDAYVATFGSALNYRFSYGGCEFLALDTTQGRDVYRTRIPHETLSWLDQTLPGISRDRPLVVLTHFPLGRNWLRPLNSAALLDRLRPYPLQAVFSGHWHGLTDRDEKGVHLSTGRCCSWWRENHDGSKLKGFALCRVSGGVVSHEFVSVT